MAMTWRQLLNPNRRRQTSVSSDHREQFERDYDRCVFSTPVKQLQDKDKAQVFLLEPHDAIHGMKELLRREVSRFCHHDDRLWKEPVVQTIRELRAANWRAVLFGGTLRSLLTSRLWHRRLGRPRDIDIVVEGADVSRLRSHFRRYLSRETRFGGLQLRRMNWQFDVWPLDRTWALVTDNVDQPVFDHLPRTTFFNVEAVAVEVWTDPGCARAIYSGDDQFFDGILRRVLEVNREDNPFPSLCVVRALVLAHGLHFRLGPRLSRYIAEHGVGLSDEQLEEVQSKHYGEIRLSSETLRGWTRHVARSLEEDPDRLVTLPIPRQAECGPGPAHQVKDRHI
jgi:hypothetical protein